MADPFAYKRDTKLQARLSAEVERLAKLPANSVCADCDERRRIRFVSVTLGVFLCNRCYGLHRALGAHVTRGKCLGLDAWKPEEVELLRAVGNVKAAALYEARVPPDLPRPTAASPDREVAAWIRDKYERRRYCAAAAAPQAEKAATEYCEARPARQAAPATPPTGEMDLLSFADFGGAAATHAAPQVSAPDIDLLSFADFGSASSQTSQQTSHGWSDQDPGWRAFS